MDTELISVIVPVYNVEKNFKKCIDSIINQTYKNLEIILVDDGSTDNSGKLCDEYLKIDSRIKVIHKKNGGLSSARNAGMNIATGNIFSFIDSDDFIDTDFYEYLMKLKKLYNANIVECNFIRAYENKLDNFYFPNVKEESIIVTTGNGGLFLFMSDDDDISTNSVVIWNKIYDKKLFNNINFPIGKLHEDQYTTYRLLAKAKVFVTSNSIKYAYYQRTNSIINQKFNSKRFDTFDAFENFIQFYDEKGYIYLQEKILKRYLKTAINFIPLISTLEGTELIENKEKLKLLFENKYNYVIKFLKSNSTFENKIPIYEKLKQDFEKSYSQI